MQSPLEFDSLSFEQVKELTDKETEIYAELSVLLEKASHSEKVKIAAIALLKIEGISDPTPQPKDSQAPVMDTCGYLIKNTELVAEAASLIDKLPQLANKLHVSHFILEKCLLSEDDFDIEELDSAVDDLIPY